MEPGISVLNLAKHYGQLAAVDRISFNVEQGEIFGFLGPNGAGKTTTIRMLTGQTKPTSGKAVVASHDIVEEAMEAKQHFGVVPEVSNVYDEMTAWDNLIFAAQLYGVPKNERDNRAKELLELFGLFERRRDRVGNFSRGMKRRLTIAAALVHRPGILFLDEPTTGLDVQSLRTIRNLIEELNRNGVTVFLTTHYIEEADQLCQRVAIINHGRIVALDNPEQLKTSAEKHQIIEISFSQNGNLQAKLQDLGHVSDVVKVGDKYRLHVEDISEAVPLLTDFAQKNRLRIISINTLMPSLEDAFVRITGLSPDVMKSEEQVKKEKGGNVG